MSNPLLLSGDDLAAMRRDTTDSKVYALLDLYKAASGRLDTLENWLRDVYRFSTSGSNETVTAKSLGEQLAAIMVSPLNLPRETPAPRELRCTKCGNHANQPGRGKYCGDGSDKDNQHDWKLASEWNQSDTETQAPQ